MNIEDTNKELAAKWVLETADRAFPNPIPARICRAAADGFDVRHETKRWLAGRVRDIVAGLVSDLGLTVLEPRSVTEHEVVDRVPTDSAYNTFDLLSGNAQRIVPLADLLPVTTSIGPFCRVKTTRSKTWQAAISVKVESELFSDIGCYVITDEQKGNV